MRRRSSSANKTKRNCSARAAHHAFSCCASRRKLTPNSDERRTATTAVNPHRSERKERIECALRSMRAFSRTKTSVDVARASLSAVYCVLLFTFIALQSFALDSQISGPESDVILFRGAGPRSTHFRRRTSGQPSQERSPRTEIHFRQNVSLNARDVLNANDRNNRSVTHTHTCQNHRLATASERKLEAKTSDICRTVVWDYPKLNQLDSAFRENVNTYLLWFFFERKVERKVDARNASNYPLLIDQNSSNSAFAGSDSFKLVFYYFTRENGKRTNYSLLSEQAQNNTKPRLWIDDFSLPFFSNFKSKH